MDWQLLISQFEPLKNDEVMLFAPAREMEQAINTYNRAIFNIGHDSMDVALIALRKLASTYPIFGQAAVLLGCCQAMLGEYDEAIEQFDHALLSGLPDDWQDRAQMMRTEVENQRQAHAALPVNGSSVQPAVETVSREPRLVPTGVVLEKARRSGKVRMASEKERQSVIRQGEFPEEEPTNVRMAREPVEYLRIAIPVVATLVVIGLLTAAGFRWLPGILQGSREQRDAAARLEWLTGRLDGLAAQDKTIADLLTAYQSAFSPTPTPSPAAAAVSSAAPTTVAQTVPTTAASATGQSATSGVTPTAAATAMPTTPTTAAPTLDSASQALQQASQLYQDAQAVQNSDQMQAGNDLLTARSLLASIPGQTVAPSVNGNAAALSQSVDKLIGNIAHDAAEAFRVPGMTAFNNKNYPGAYDYFLKAYQLLPTAYGGGVAYYCGRCCQLTGDKPTARIYYDYVVATFAGRDIAASAAARLKEMGF